MRKVIWISVILMSLILFAGCSKSSLSISSITATPSLVGPNGYSHLAATIDYDGDKTLTYQWNGGGGTIVGAGNAVEWIAPATTGTYTVTLTVSDGDVSDESTIQIVAGNEMVVTIVAPAAGDTVDANLLIQAETGSNAVYLEFLFDTFAVAVDSTSPYSMNFDVSAYPDGPGSATVIAHWDNYVDTAMVNFNISHYIPNYFPLAVGNSWTFLVHIKNSVGGDSTYNETQSLSRSVIRGTEEWYVMLLQNDTLITDSVYYIKTTLFVRAGYVYSSVFVPVDISPVYPAVGVEWNQDTLLSPLLHLQYEGDVETYQLISVPEGMHQCFKEVVSVTNPIVRQLIYWVADSVGPVIVIDINGADTTTMELQSYIVN
jgi:hypothetical protein